MTDKYVQSTNYYANGYVSYLALLTGSDGRYGTGVGAGGFISRLTCNDKVEGEIFDSLWKQKSIYIKYRRLYSMHDASFNIRYSRRWFSNNTSFNSRTL
jgi:hypothetical protein